MLEILNKDFKNITLYSIRNEIKRELKDYVELRGTRKTGGYYIKK